MDIEWENGKLRRALILGGINTVNRIPVVYNGVRVDLDLKPGKTTALTIKDFR